MENEGYTQEIKKRVRKRIIARFGGTRKTLPIIIGAPILANIILFFVTWVIWDIDTARQNLFWELGLVAIVEFILGSLLIYWRFFDVPEEIYEEQCELIKRQDGIINPEVNIVTLPDKGDVENNTQYVFLRIHNKSGAKEIINCSVDLIDVQKQGSLNDYSRKLPVKMAWGAGFPSVNGMLNIPRGGEVLLDVAHVDSIYENGRFDLEYNREWIRFNPGSYDILIQINGNIDEIPFSPIRKELEIILIKGISIDLQPKITNKEVNND